MNWKHLGVGALALALAAGPALAADSDDSKKDTEAARAQQEQARKEMEAARQEVEKARQELQRATRELARSMAKVETDNPRAQYFAYMTDPNRAVLGVLISDEVENGEDRGVRLLAVTPGSGADKAGLKAGDLVLSMNGTSLARDGKKGPQGRMRDVLKSLKAGDSVKVDYERDGKRQTATIVTQPPEPDLAMAPPPSMLDEMLHDPDFMKFGPMSQMPMFQFRGPVIHGLELCKLDADLGSYFKTTDGVLVVKAPKNGALSLKSGDVIQKIDGQAVTEPVTVLDMLRSRDEEQNVKLDIVRQGKKMQLEGKIPVASVVPPMPPMPPRDMHRHRVVASPGPDSDDGT